VSCGHWKVTPIAVIAVMVRRSICSISEREWRRREGLACVYTPCASSASWPRAPHRAMRDDGLLVEHLSGTTLEGIPAFHMGTLEALTPVALHTARITDRLLSVSRPHGLQTAACWSRCLTWETANVLSFRLVRALKLVISLRLTGCLTSTVHLHRHREKQPLRKL
jgi:hypothetical protein